MVLGATEEQELTVAEAEDAGLVAEPFDPVEEALVKAVAARGRQGNMSFFAFTATPKARTLEMFGTLNAATRKYEPFHLYSMRQAIEEGFILDVLANYTTYKTYWRIEKAIEDDPEYSGPKARRAIARFVSLHPTNLAQKAEIIVEHFRAHVAAKIAGRAKAMVVTSSRLHAVRYKQAIDSYIAKAGYSGIATLVAFSGRVIDDKQLHYTEQQMNGFPESETARRFGGEGYHVLVVAEKFRTRLRPAAAPHHIRGQGAHWPQRRPDAFKAQQDPPQRRRHLRVGLPQRDRRHREGLRALLRPHSCTTY